MTGTTFVLASSDPCPTCEAAVTEVSPIIVEGRAHRFMFGSEPIIVQGDDEVAGFELIPCGHKVDGLELGERGHVIWMVTA